MRKETHGLRCYVHIGTGNYHVKTARLYTDVGSSPVTRCSPRDVVNLFHYLTVTPTPRLSSRSSWRPSICAARSWSLIGARSSTSGPAARRIIAKMNQLEDPDIIAALVRGIAAGVSIDLIIRGFCCLRPGVPGRTENIRVRSIIGRFLEHSRIFHFANGHESPVEGEFFIGSADWMSRNLSKRIEVATPVLAEGPRESSGRFSISACATGVKRGSSRATARIRERTPAEVPTVPRPSELSRP